MLLIEICLTALAVPLAFLAPRLGDRWFTWIERRVSHFAAHRRLAVLTIFVLALAGRVAVLPIEPIPQPAMHDEFSYLLNADTFAHGRLTNPTHPMWMHFETFHVNQQPTYCSMYYPAQGLFLAFGQVVFGHPFWGVCLSAGLMCAAICWALQGWMPPASAFFGGILAIIRLGTFSYWANSYWGGAVPAIGGALVLGALPRIRRHWRASNTVILGLGLAILGNSRPYESVFYSAPILVALGLFIFRSKDRLLGNTRRILLPLGIVLVVTLSAMGYYFWQCTGSPVQTPYMVNVRTYQVAPLFPWQTTRSDITYRHPMMEKYYIGWALHQYEDARDHPALHLLARGVKAILFFSDPILILPWLVLGVILPYGMSFRQLGPKTGLLVKVSVAGVLGLSLPVGFEPHYAAPVCCAFYALQLQAIRRIRLWDMNGRRKGKFLVRYIVFVCFFLLALRIFAGVLRTPVPAEVARTWYGGNEENPRRTEVADSLGRQPGRQLAIVRYDPNHNPIEEWLSNGADMEDSKVVWARDMGEAQNLELIHYFRGRKVWLVEPDKMTSILSPYTATEAAVAHEH